MKEKLEAYYGLPNDVKFCKRCVISNQRPSSTVEFKSTIKDRKEVINFDENGICSACRYHDEKELGIDWNQRDEQLRELLSRFKSKNGGYDVIVPGSGGKDSAYTSHILKYKYGMNPLTVTWAPHAYTDIGWKNFQNWMYIGGLDNILYTPNGVLHREMTRNAFLNLLHPFIAFLKNGIKDLSYFYNKFRPYNLVEMYFLSEEKIKIGKELPPWELPWVPRDIMSMPAEEGGIPVDQGVSYFGPVSAKKLSFEAERLLSIKESILKKGYQPNSEINGFFLEYKNDFVFFVRGGKHRAAVLSYLNYKKIPVVIRKAWPPVFQAKNVENWPLVKSGEIDKAFALDVFKSYFENNGISQFNKLKINNYEDKK